MKLSRFSSPCWYVALIHLPPTKLLQTSFFRPKMRGSDESKLVLDTSTPSSLLLPAFWNMVQTTTHTFGADTDEGKGCIEQ